MRRSPLKRSSSFTARCGGTRCRVERSVALRYCAVQFLFTFAQVRYTMRAMADELSGIDDDLPDWATSDVHDVPADDPPDGDQDTPGDATASKWRGESPG